VPEINHKYAYYSPNVARMKDITNEYKILVGKCERKSPIER